MIVSDEHIAERIDMLYDVLDEIRKQVTELRIAHDNHFTNWNKKNGMTDE